MHVLDASGDGIFLVPASTGRSSRPRSQSCFDAQGVCSDSRGTRGQKVGGLDGKWWMQLIFLLGRAAARKIRWVLWGKIGLKRRGPQIHPAILIQRFMVCCFKKPSIKQQKSTASPPISCSNLIMLAARAWVPSWRQTFQRRRRPWQRPQRFRRHRRRFQGRCRRRRRQRSLRSSGGWIWLVSWKLMIQKSKLMTWGLENDEGWLENNSQ